jgi:hypothetical protein
MKIKTKEIKKCTRGTSFADIETWGLFRFPGAPNEVCLKINANRYICIGDEHREASFSDPVSPLVIKLDGELTWWEV